MKTFISLPLIVLLLASCGKAKEMPTFPGLELEPFVVSPLISQEIEVKIERMDDLKADFSNYKEFIKSLNYHRLTFTPKTGSLAGYTAECHDPSVKETGKSKASYFSESIDNNLVVLTFLNTQDLNPADLKCELKNSTTQITKTVRMKKSLQNPTGYTAPLDLDVLLIDGLTLVTLGKDVTIKANKLVSRKGKITSSLVTTANYAKDGIPVPGGLIDLRVAESMGDLTVELIGQDAISGIDGGDTGSLKMALPNLENFKLKVKYFKGHGGLGIVSNGEIGEPGIDGINGLSRIELTDTKETFEFDSDWMN